MINALFFNNSRHCLLLLILLHSIAANSQTNLIPNPSFELYAGCPNSGFSPIQVTSWIKMQMNVGTFYHICANGNLNPKALGVPYNALTSGYNYQYPHTGNGYVGFLTTNANWYIYRDFKIYQGVQLKRSLSTKCYYAEFYVVLANQTKLATNNIGMYITTTKQTADTNSPAKYYIPANPQVLNYGNPIIKDTQNWVRVSGVFSAEGGEQYITIGNFKHDTATALDSFNVASYIRRSGYCLDDVAVYDLDSIPQYVLAGRDTSIALGDSVFIGSNSGGLQNAIWYNSSGAVINTGVPGFFVKPTSSTYYVVQLSACSSFRQDTVRVNVGTVPLKFISYTLRQAQGDNPSSLRGTKQSVENLWVTANEINVSHFNILKSVNGVDFKAIGKIAAKNKSVNEYSFIDGGAAPSPLGEGWGEVYYKIAAIDFDGKMSFSEVRKIEYRTRNNELRIYPNPAKEFVTVACKGAKELLVIDCLGRVVYKEILRQAQNDNKPSTIINVQWLNKGLYLLKVITIKGEVKSEKLIVE